MFFLIYFLYIFVLLYPYSFRLCCCENQSVCNMKYFLYKFRQRLIDCYLQDRYSTMSSKDLQYNTTLLSLCREIYFLAFYFSVIESHPLACYLFTIKKSVLRRRKRWFDSDKVYLLIASFTIIFKKNAHECLPVHFATKATNRKFIFS